ncbi:MAG TPA: NAD(P)H-binding protein [Sphingobium sp.]|nr:NAD(P)H-binding protein [Sphingobium sp.]
MPRIVVNGASGAIGSLIVEELMRHVPVADLTLVTRSPAKLAKWVEQGVRVCQGDYCDPASLERAYDGGDTLMMISGLNILKRIPEHRNAIAAAKRAGIGHIVYTSVSGVHPMNRTPSSSDHIATEAMLWESGLDFTALRNQAYSELMTPMAEVALRTGEWRHIGVNGLYSPVSRADIARCAAAILREPERHRRVCYEITGPELISFQDLAARFAQMYERPIRYIPVTAEEMWVLFDSWGVPRVGNPEATDPAHMFGSNELVENYVAWDELFHAVVSRHVEFITGRKAVPLHDVMLAAKGAMLEHLAQPLG